MPMTVTIKVEYEGKSPKDDLGIQEKFSLEAIRDAKVDLVAIAIYRMVDMIHEAREVQHAARHPRKNP